MFRFDAADIPGEVVRCAHLDHGYSLFDIGQVVGPHYSTISRLVNAREFENAHNKTLYL